MTLLRVMTYNIHRGKSAFRRRDVLTEVVRVLHEEDPDVLCLQEVWKDKGLDHHQLAEVCRERWAHGRFQVNAYFPRGAQGNAVISRWPILSEDRLDLTVAGREPRGLLHVVIGRLEQRPLHVFCAHFGLASKEREVQTALAQEYVMNQLTPGAAAVMAGDFNDWADSQIQSAMASAGFLDAFVSLRGGPARTYPAIMPVFPLDRIFIRGLWVDHIRCPGHFRRISDHLPLVATISDPPRWAWGTT